MRMSSDQTIIYTLTDEAPLLATHAFLPVVSAFAKAAGVTVAPSDISVAARILAAFPERLTPEQRMPDALVDLGHKTLQPETNIIKLPNISASVSQLEAAIKELQEKGYDIPSYPADAKTDEEKAIKAKYGKCIGSAVNPVLREGNSDRRAPRAVKEYARKNPHSMAKWSPASRTHVSHMTEGDFYHGEKSMTIAGARDVKMELITKSGQTIVLKNKVSLLDGEIIDSMFMSRKALLKFYEEQIEDAKETGVMFSLHVKATMMKVSHPIVFGHCVRMFYKEAFEKHGELFDSLKVNVNNGMADLYNKIDTLPVSQRDEIIRDIHACQEHRPALAMVDSAKGITNFHSPNDVIVDASMPAMIRAGGKMYGADGRLHEVKAVIPESTFARIYQEILNFCKWHGAFDPKTMGTVPNVGLMAQQAEEYGSHDKTFEVTEAGVANITDLATGEVLLSQNVEEGDIWRMCQVKDAPIRDWVKLAVTRARNSGMPAVFWLDPYRPHENELIKKVKAYLKEHDTAGLDIQIMSQVRAMRYTLERVIRGLDTISVTGNILRDYLTDLFPIMELGTSAKMLSIVPLMAGGGMYETCSSWLKKTTCAGIRWASSWRWPCRSRTWVSRPATRRPKCWPKRWTRPPASCSTTASRRRQKPANSTTAAASSTCRCTGRRNWPRRLTTPNWRHTLRQLPKRSRRTKRPSSPSCWQCRASRSISAATTSWTKPRSAQRCVRARRSTPRSTRWCKQTV
jgi:isocitrate dehydrogenase